MNIVTVQSRTTRVAVAFQLVDAVTGRAPVSEVTVRLEGVDQTATVTPDGYVLFLDLPEAEYNVLVESRDYALFTSVVVNTASLDLVNSIVVLNLEPRASYPFPPNTTLLYGTIVNQVGVPVADARIEVMGGEFDGTFANTDASGRCVLYFDLVNNSKNINLTVSKESFENKAVSVTILREHTVEFAAEIVGVTGANVAVVRGMVRDAENGAVPQAVVSISPWGLTSQTGPDGRFAIARSVSANENITLTISQDGYSDESLMLTALKGQLVEIDVCLNLDLLEDTACLEVRVVDGGSDLEGALVEIIEKGRSGITNADGEVRFYFNDLQKKNERINIRASKPGYTSKTSRKKIRRGRNSRHTMRLRSAT